ncbi:polysaccharide pyruvyl transferase family protein [Rhodosalinus halophilus]|uniref:polysaccharide pyruvyl transferase family protein n=1 Tax=Rhodosalinus halophilus TaxID=2259333 RepID=UPI0013148B2C|nr:polysaccharide pyruvyl transferase family protein [Rhodosalinus halophilus]
MGDQAIARALSEILEPHYRVSITSFGQIGSNPSIGSSNIPVRSGKPLALRIFSGVQPYAKAQIKWHILGEKHKYGEHFESAIKDSDLVLVGGGQLIKNNIALFCEKLALVSRVSEEHSKPFAMVGVGADVRMKKKNWLIVRKAIRNSKFTIVRDEISKRRIYEALNGHINPAVLPDLAFALKNSARKRRRPDRSISLALNIMNPKTMHKPLGLCSKSYIDRCTEMVCEFPDSYREDLSSVLLFTSGSPDDLAAARELQEGIRKTTAKTLPIFHPRTLEELLAFLANTKNVVAARMHAGILAYISGCNPLCINWDDKVEGVWSTVGESARVIGLDEIATSRGGASILGKLRCLRSPSDEELDSLADMVCQGVLNSVGQALSMDGADFTCQM